MHPYVAQFTMTFLTILTWSVVARALIGWLPIDQSSTVYQVLFRITEPVIDPIRRVLPNTGMLDLSPLAAILVLIVLQQMVVQLSEIKLSRSGDGVTRRRPSLVRRPSRRRPGGRRRGGRASCGRSQRRPCGGRS